MRHLTGKQSRHLRRLAHPLKPLVIVGADRLSPGLIAKVDAELSVHELIKVRLTDAAREEVVEAEGVLCSRTGASLVQTIGHTLVLYRVHPTTPRIRLPRA